MNQCYGIGGKRGPPWNVALGTPVLVIAALGHAGETGGKAIWKRLSKRTLQEYRNGSDEERVMGSGSDSEVDIEREAGRERDEPEEHREERMDKNVERESSRA